MQRGCKFRVKINAKLPRVETLSQAENTDGQKLEPTIPKEGGWNKHTARRCSSTSAVCLFHPWTNVLGQNITIAAVLSKRQCAKLTTSGKKRKKLQSWHPKAHKNSSERMSICFYYAEKLPHKKFCCLSGGTMLSSCVCRFTEKVKLLLPQTTFVHSHLTK